ncbi:Glutamine-dependent NAD(+) synthetase [Sedimentisphaera cyanobacteriorum]|uniref:Glutamine-dependent NAD(+) synthetase n=1 Tax=Sedimentisphaera cyanobacteriorum TaxID=1940790 RepID=A0A1Q2HRK6_9BACT|nr:NAD+ synthase [Sedimentisphaera cyanobacteriorum]AQQ10098.1 Glutamine-dependent NAD(+) synthetase [Sedimentisphaera cyanobacteriorum]
MRIAAAQINPVVGDLKANAEKILSAYQQAAEKGVQLVVFPEMSISGYPPEDLLFKKHFLNDCLKTSRKLAEKCNGPAIIFGSPNCDKGGCFNSLFLASGGEIQTIYNKMQLPNYGVFDERRYFSTGKTPLCFDVAGISVGLSICEDIWEPEQLELYRNLFPGMDIFVNISASPFHKGKIEERKQIISNCSKKLQVPVIYCNLVGGQDELVFDGRSIITDSAGNIIAKANYFEEDIIYADLRKSDGETDIIACQEKAPQPRNVVEEVYEALVLGTGDYVRKNGFEKVIIGISGGIDSALAAAIAVKALGSENVFGITMPSKFNKSETITDAELLARNLAISFKTVPISETLSAFHKALSLIPGWDDSGTAYENLQARIRGTILMSLSNQFGYMVLTTGNKSETAVGYSTLYGDTAGGFAVIKDVTKTMVYRLSRYINEKFGELIPESTITRPPSAELREEQIDADSLPDYDLLDALIKGYVEQDKSADQLRNEGCKTEDINRVLRMVDFNEYKRRQSPPGIKITPKAFGRDRRLPITNKYRSQVRE